MSKKNQKENDEKIKTENTDKEAVNEEKSDENDSSSSTCIW